MAEHLHDSPLHRIVITEMTAEQVDAHLNGIRERRLKPIRIYKEAMELKKQLLASKLTAKLDKTLKMFEKELAQDEKYIKKLEKRATMIRAILLELEDYDDGSGRDIGGGEQRGSDGGVEVTDQPPDTSTV